MGIGSFSILRIHSVLELIKEIIRVFSGGAHSSIYPILNERKIGLLSPVLEKMLEKEKKKLLKNLSKVV